MNRNAKRILDEAARLFCATRVDQHSHNGLGIVEERREGPYVCDSDGAEYIDLRTDSGSFNLGRRNPEIIRTLEEALRTYDIGNNVYYSPVKIALAKKLVSLFPKEQLGCVSYHVSGAEAVDFAVKLARGHTGRTEVVSSRTGFYGTSGFPLSADGEVMYRRDVGPVAPGFRAIPYNSVPALEEAVTERTAAVLLEPLEGEGGVHVPSPGYFAEVREICDRHGTVMIVDEVLTGFGRTGRMLAIDRYGIVPDVITLGKSLSGGLYPITACLFKRELQDFINRNPFSNLSAFAGSDLGCAVALRAIELTEQLGLADRAQELGDLLKYGLTELQREHPLIVSEVRGRGLMLAVEMRDSALGAGLTCALRRRGVLASFLPHKRQILRLLPALVIDEADVMNIVEAFSGALEEIAEPARLFDLHVRQPDPLVSGTFW